MSPHTPDDQTKANIQSAVETLSKDISAEFFQAEEQKKKYLHHEKEHDTKHAMMFIGVLFFAVLIAGMWAINIKSMVSMATRSQGTEQTLIKVSQQEFDEVFRIIEETEHSVTEESITISEEIELARKEALQREEIKHVLGTFLVASPTPPSSTPPTTTTQ